MAKKVKLTEADLNRIVKKVINEQGISGAVINAMSSFNQQPGGASAAAKSIGATNNPKIKALAAYLKQNKVTSQEIRTALMMNKGQGAAQGAAQRPAQPQQQSGSWMDSAGQAIKKGINAVQGYEQQGLNKVSQGLNSVANYLKPQQKQGGVAKAAQRGVAKAAQPTSGGGQGTTKPAQPTSGSGQGGVAKAAQSQPQMTPQQLQANKRQVPQAEA